LKFKSRDVNFKGINLTMERDWIKRVCEREIIQVCGWGWVEKGTFTE